VPRRVERQERRHRDPPTTGDPNAYRLGSTPTFGSTLKSVTRKPNSSSATLAAGSRNGSETHGASTHTDQEPHEEGQGSGEHRACQGHAVMLLNGPGEQKTDSPDEATEHGNRKERFEGHRLRLIRHRPASTASSRRQRIAATALGRRLLRYVRAHPRLAVILRQNGLGSKPAIVEEIAAHVHSTGCR
jgi:hypothetical protein